jgi:hypothetical protein
MMHHSRIGSWSWSCSAIDGIRFFVVIILTRKDLDLAIILTEKMIADF